MTADISSTRRAPSGRARALRVLAMAMGVACTGIGLVHLAGGLATIPGETTAGATVDSRERFYNAIFAGYGLAWIWVARQRPVPTRTVRALSGVFLLGGAGRLLSLAVAGPPHWFQDPLTGLELALPPLFWWLAPADEHDAQQ